MARIRKALVAGLGAAAATIITGLIGHIPTDKAAMTALLLSAVGAGVAVAWATYKIPNAPAIKPSPYGADGR